MKKIKVAQIGTSRYSHGNFIWGSLIKQRDIFDVAGYAFPEKEREKFPDIMDVFDGYREMTAEEILADPTIVAVTIETEERYLAKYALMAAKAGKHIHLEKPGFTDPADFEALVQVVKEKNLVLHLGYMYRYNPTLQALMARVKEGELGDVISVEAQMNGIYPPTAEARQWLSCLPGGNMLFLGCHMIDLILQIRGIPETVIPFNCVTGAEGTTAEDFAMAILRYNNGVCIAKANAAEVLGYNRRQLVISGTKGTAECKPLEISYGGGAVSTPATECLADKQENIDGGVFDRYDGMLAAFAGYVRGDRQNPYAPEYEMALCKILHKACGQI